MSQLYEQICSFENLFEAFHRARRGKRHQESVARFERNLELELFQLQDELVECTYQPGPYRSFYRTEAKRRLISAAPFRDRVVHHALVGVLEPFFERRFIFDSYANRVGKGTHRALDRCTKFLRSHEYVLPCDVRQFFPSIDHQILYEQLRRVIPQTDVLWLVERILRNGVGVLDEEYQMRWFPGDDLFALNRPRGLPLGNLTSQFWANVYLNDLDHFIKRDLKCRSYLRYVDDFLLFNSDKRELLRWRADLIEFLQSLRLTIHENSAQIRPCFQGLTFLGFIVYPDHRRLKSASGHAFEHRIKKLLRAYQDGEIEQDKISASVRGWLAHCDHGDTWGLRRAILKKIVV